MGRMTTKEMAEYKALYKQYDRLAKRADDRMRALEDLATSKEGYERVLNYAYKKAEIVISKSWGGSNRWRSNAPKRLAGLKEKMRDIETWLHYETSKAGTVTRILDKRAKSLNKTLNEGLAPGEPQVEFTWEDMARFFESGAFQKLKEREYDSKTYFKMLYQAVKKEDEYEKFLKDKKKDERKAAREAFNKKVDITMSRKEKKALKDSIMRASSDTVFWNTVDAVNETLKKLGVEAADFFR